MAVALLFVLARNATFFHDEWMYIRDRSFADPASWFAPHNQHFVLLHAAVYTGLYAIFGTTTYLPYLAVLFAAHVAFVAAVYALIDRHVGRGPALGAAAVLLVLGAGFTNLYWAFMSGPIAAVALALWGLCVIRERPWLAAVLMALGAMTHAHALMVVPAAAVYGANRKALAACALPVAVYGAWYLWARDGMAVYGEPPTLAGFVGWIPEGLTLAAAAVTGLGQYGMVVLLVALVALLRVPDRRAAIVGLVAILTEYTILGLSRQGANTPAAPAYIYFGAAFILPVFVSAWPTVPRLARPALVLAVGAVVAWNVVELVRYSIAWPAYMAFYDPLCLTC